MMITKKITKETTEEMLKRIKQRTPVDTGTARNGWFINKDGDIQNDVPYVIYLEMGSSDQSPKGMVRITALEAEEILKRLAR